MCGLGFNQKIVSDIIIMDDQNHTEQSQNGFDAEQRRPRTFEDAVNILIETSHETQKQVKDMKECFENMTSQLITAFTKQSDANKTNQ